MKNWFNASANRSDRNEGYDTERSQAIVRVVIVFLGIAYIAHEALTRHIPDPFRWIIIALCTVVAVTSVLILVAVLRRPGVSHRRRIVDMAHRSPSIITHGPESPAGLPHVRPWA